MRRTIRPLLILVGLLAGCIIEDESDYPLRLDALLDASDVSLAAAMSVPDRALSDSLMLAGELDVDSRSFEADLWDGESLLRAQVDLDGVLIDVDDLGWNPRADSAVDVIVAAEISLYDAIAIAQDEIADARAFEVTVKGDLFEIAVLSHLRTYHVWISPRDGHVVDVDLESNYVHHHFCPCW